MKIPSPTTLRKYGLDEPTWKILWLLQGEVCAICKKYPKTENTHIDHEHVKGFKNMPSSEKRKYVRGITCWFCNRWVLARGMTLEKAKNVVEYLEMYEERRPK